MAERLRIREMTSYFAAVGINVDDTGRLRASSPPAEPALSDDAVLNSLTQTGALRLGCDRAFVSLIGQHWQYIVAEASPQLPYRRKNLTPTDRMCMGFTAIASEMAICLNTLKSFTDTTGRSAVDDGNTQADTTRYRIRDLRADPVFHDRPYVTQWPHFRAYLEVPLTTSTGLVIGSYCVIDSHLRDDFGDGALPIVIEVAQNVMDHLDLLKMKQQCERAERLVRGLSVFVAGCSSLRDLPRDRIDHAPPYDVPFDDSVLSADDAPASSRELSPGSSGTRFSSGGTELLSSTTELTTPMSSITDMDPLDFHGAASKLDESPPSFDDAVPHGGPQSKTSPAPATPHDAHMAFSRAANLIREATSIEGIVFLDACPSSFGPLKTTPRHAKRHSSEETAVPLLRDFDAEPMCEILGSSTGSRTAPINEGFKVPEALLQRLIHSEPRGGLIYADENGPISPCVRAADEEPSAIVQRAAREDVKQLLGILPQARSILFLPLWDYQKGTWYAAAVGWTTDPTHSFEEKDMTYISAFSNSIMAEVARLDALVTSAAKGNFISSISHEFRSPLHGIMASTELLEELSQDPDHSQLTGMIRSCATTLIDTTNHLLDFAKINKLVKDEQARPTRPRLGRASLSSDQSALGQEPGGSATLSSTVDLAQLVEEVVEGASIGHASQAVMKPQDALGLSTDAPIIVTMNIERRDGWSLRTEPGAWKRIVMNIFGNALKYTARGSVDVSLKTIKTPLSPDSHRTDICFAVADTGCGMSADYVKRQLFTPYSQANSLSTGVGLGLSIVQHLVKELGGAIHVQSTPDVGTLVSVTVPTDAITGPLLKAAEAAPDGPNRDVVDILRGKAVAALDLGFSGGDQTLLPTFTAMAKTWMDVDVVSADEARGMGDVPLIVLCKSAPDARQKGRALFENATFLVQPFGPRKLAWTIRRAFTRHAASVSAATGPLARMKEEGRERGRKDGREKDGGRGRTRERECRGRGQAGEGEGKVEGKVESGRGRDDISTSADLACSIKNLSMDAVSLKEASPVGHVDPSLAAIANLPPSHAQSLPPQPQPLPLQPQSLPPPPPQPQSPPPPPPTTTERRPHVLAVDDNGVNLKILTTHMKKMKCTYETATNGLEAVKAFQAAQHPFDYIFMDISMPVMDGFEATREIRAHEAGSAMPRVKILALTGLGSSSSQKEAFASGVDIYLMKPVPLKKLKELVLGSGDA